MAISAAPDAVPGSASLQVASSELAESLPLIRADRNWSFVDVACVKSGLVIATWAFMFGAATAQTVGFWDGVFAIFVGNAIGVILLLLAVVLPSSKWGTEFFVHQRSVYGPLGVLLFVLVVIVINLIGWVALLATMTGKAVAEIARSSFPGSPVPLPILTTLVSLLVLFITWRLIVRGSRGVRLLNLLVAPALVLMCVWMMASIFSQVSFSTIVAAPPIKPDPDRMKNLMLAIELNIASGLSWFQLAANLGRYAKTQRAAVWGSFVGYVPVNGLAYLVGLTSALALGSADPVTWMVPIVGPLGGAILLLVLVLANVSTLVAMMQGSCQTLVQILGPRVQSLGWSGVTLAVLLGAAVVVVLATDALYDSFNTLVSFGQAVFAPACGIALADRVALRGNYVNLRALYEKHADSDYHFWRRINPFAFVAMGAGAWVYVWLINPVSFATAPAFVYITASLPAMATAFALHIVLTRYVVIRAGKGSYAQRLGTVTTALIRARCETHNFTDS